MKLKRLYLLFSRLGLVLSRYIFRVAEQTILDRQAYRKKQNARRIKRPVAVELDGLLQNNGKKSEKAQQGDIAHAGDPRRLIASDQTTVVNGVMRDRRKNDDQNKDEKM